MGLKDQWNETGNWAKLRFHDDGHARPESLAPSFVKKSRLIVHCREVKLSGQKPSHVSTLPGISAVLCRGGMGQISALAWVKPPPTRD